MLTVPVTCTASDQNGNPVAGARVTAKLNQTEIYLGHIVPESITAIADANGVAILNLWPNALGTQGSMYRVTATNPDTGRKYLDAMVSVPNSACNLHQIMTTEPYPAIDASQQALAAAQGALAMVTTQAGIATTKAGQASASQSSAAASAASASESAEAISDALANGPVLSVNGLAGVITGLATTAALAASSGSSLVGYQPAGSSSSTTVQAKLREFDAAGEYGNNFIAAGQPTNLNGSGKGGFKVGGGTPESTNGVWLSLDGASNWLVAQTSKNENPTELIVYGSSAQGYAVTNAGTGRITKVWGSDFKASWVGNTVYFLRKKFRVSSFIDANNLTVTELGGSSVTFGGAETEAFTYVYTTGSGLCNISGTTITFVSGDPFVPLFFSDFSFTLNGVVTSLVSADSPTQYTASAPPGNGVNVPYTWRGNVNDQITTLRIQAIQGDNEENVNLMSIAGDNFLGRHYALVAGLAGSYGRFRPIFIGSGSYTDSSYQHQFGCYPRDAYPGVSSQGYASIGGVQGREGLRVYSPNSSTPLANRLSVQGAVTGFAPAIRAEGSDSNIAFGIDAKGDGQFSVTQSFSRTLLRARGAGSTVNWLSIDASNTATPVTLNADGSDVNIDIRLAPKGTGFVWVGPWAANGDAPVNGYITVKDLSGSVRKLATIA